MFVFYFFIGLQLFSQNVGDYRSKTNGTWTSVASWEQYNGTTWVDATEYPGQSVSNALVTILAGHEIMIGSSGISTQAIGEIVIDGTLFLSGSITSAVDYIFNVPKITVTPNLTPYATIRFKDKVNLILPTNGIIVVSTGGLSGDCSNHQKITMASPIYAACNGAPGDIFTFAELMAGGGTINSIATVPVEACLEDGSVSLLGDYSGAIANAPTYLWAGENPLAQALTFSPNATSKNVSFVPDIAGDYIISLQVSTVNDGTTYSNTEYKTLFVSKRSLPPTSATASSMTICEGESTTLTLHGGGGGTDEQIVWYIASCGGTSVGSGNNLSVSPTVTTTYYGRYENVVPCNYATSCVQVTITVNVLSAAGIISGNQNVCIGTTPTAISLSGSIGNIQWEKSSDNVSFVAIDGATSATLSLALMGDVTPAAYFRAVVTNGVCSPAVSSISSVTMRALPIVETVDTTICLGDTATLRASGALTYNWSDGQSGAKVFVQPLFSTQYSVFGTDSYGCQNSATVDITVLSVPSLTITGNQAICAGDEVRLEVSGADSYMWSTGETTVSITKHPLSTTAYTVIGYALNSCFTVGYVSVYVNDVAVALSSGDWENPAIWDILAVPNSCTHVVINPDVEVSLNTCEQVASVSNFGSLFIRTLSLLEIDEEFTNQPASTLRIAGTIDAAGGYSFDSDNNTVIYQSSTADQTVISEEYFNLGISNSNSFNAYMIGDIHVYGDLIINGSLISTSDKLYVGGNFINNGLFEHNSGIVLFNGDMLQVVGGDNQIDYNNLTIYNTGQGIQLTNDITIYSAMQLSAGILAALNHHVIFQEAAIVQGASHESHITGNVQKYTHNTPLFVFPIGDGIHYRPITILEPSDNLWSSQYFCEGFGFNYDVSQVGNPKLHHVSELEYWDLTPEILGGTCKVLLTWSEYSDVLFPEDLLIAHWNEATKLWETVGDVSIDEFNRNIESVHTVTMFSPFTLGTSSEDGALPIELIMIDGYCNDEQSIILTWTTASEIHNNMYTVLRSNNGVDWEVIGVVPSKGDSKEITKYVFIDSKFENNYSYYKLMQTDNNGKSEEFDVMCVFCNNKGVRFSPVLSQGYIDFEFYNKQGTADVLTVNTYNSNAILVCSQKIQVHLHENSHTITLPQNLSEGAYFVEIRKGDSLFYAAAFIK